MRSQLASPSALWPFRQSVPGRMAATLLALLPIVLAQSIVQGTATAARLAIALAFAFCLDALLLAARARPPLDLASGLQAACIAVLLTLLLPMAAPAWPLLAAIAIAIAISRHAFGGLGHELFNPVMAGYGCVLLLVSPWPGAPEAAHAAWQAAACLLGGVFLLVVGVISWRAPLAMLATASLLEFALGASHAGIAWLDGGRAFVLLLVAFFVVGDPITGCSTPRGRLAFGAGCGALAVLFDPSGVTPGAIAFAILGMNLVAPWLDRALAPRREVASR